jgi:error-prone DNA polymerase
MSFVHLHTHSYYSFLDGVDDPQEIASRCASYDMPAVALTDRNTVSGIVRFAKSCREVGVKPILGAEVTLWDDSHLTLLCRNETGYANLCRLLTDAHLSNERGSPRVPHSSVLLYADGLICLTGCRKGAVSRALIRRDFDGAERFLRELVGGCGRENVFVELQRTCYPGDALVTRWLRELAERVGVSVVATNDVRHIRRKDIEIQQVVTCIRTGRRIDEPNPELALNAERYLKSPRAMAALFADCPEAVENTLRVAERVESFPLGGKRFMPKYPFLAEGEEAARVLWRKVFEGARRRYRTLAEPLKRRLEHELYTIIALGFEDYFLILADIVETAANKGIRFTGRGSAADSVVAYCLRLTEVDAFARDHQFARFISIERQNGLPDVDLDFDWRYRDKVVQYVFDTYGEDHAAGLATFQTYHARGAMRDVGKVLGLQEDELRVIGKRLPWFAHAERLEEYLDTTPQARALNIAREKYGRLFHLVRRIAGIPRHVGTHSSGILLTGPPIWGVSPLMPSAKGIHISPFDKVAIEELTLIKIDFLFLRTHGAIQDTVQVLQRQDIQKDDGGSDGEPFSLDGLPLDDKETYLLLNTGETAGIFQYESAAQRALQRRIAAKTFEDLIQATAAVRPGPIKGEVVEPWIKRLLGEEPIEYMLPELEPILKRTYGVMLYQEQVIEVCSVVAGFSPGEADGVRRLMTHRRSYEDFEKIHERFVNGAAGGGYSREIAEKIWSCVQAYGGYGFCEGHAASFARIGYDTAYLLTHHPVEFYCGLLNNQPLGYWPAHVLVTEAKRRGIEVSPLDIRDSREDTLPVDGRIRIGWRSVARLSVATRERFREEQRRADFESVPNFVRRVRPQKDELEPLIIAGAFDGFHPNRRALLWAFHGGGIPMEAGDAPSLDGTERLSLPNIPDFSDGEKCALEWKAMGFSPRWHPMEFRRESLRTQGILTCAEAKAVREGSYVKVAGLAVRPHTPPTKSGRRVLFTTLADETGLLDVTVFPDVYERFGGQLFWTETALVVGIMQDKYGLALIADGIVAVG